MKVEDYFELKKQETDQSFAFLIEKCEHSQECPYGIKLCELDFNKTTIVFLPGTADEKNKLLPFNEALKRMQKLVVITYCHGAYTWMKMEEHLPLLFMKGVYSRRQKKRLLKSITVLAYSPDCPLGYSQTKFISFSSASDLSIQHGNGFVRYVHRNMFVKDFGLSYLSGKLGRAFYCAQYSKNGVEGNPRVLRAVDPQVWYENLHHQSAKARKSYISEHDFLGFCPYPNMSKAAFKMQRIAMCVLEGVIGNSIAKKPQNLSVFLFDRRFRL